MPVKNTIPQRSMFGVNDAIVDEISRLRERVAALERHDLYGLERRIEKLESLRGHYPGEK